MFVLLVPRTLKNDLPQKAETYQRISKDNFSAVHQHGGGHQRSDTVLYRAWGL